MAYKIIRPATRDEWLEERKKGIGSSDAGTIMGVSSFNTPYGLYLQKKGLAEPFKENDAMFNGHILEPAVAEWFEKKTGNIVDKTSEGDWIAVDTKREYLRVSPDRIYYPAGTPKEKQTYENGFVLEIKSTSKNVSQDYFPDYWFCQVQYQMGILGVKKACIAWITGNPKLQFDYVEVNFNQGFFNTLIRAIEKFWLENYLKGIPPQEINGSDAARKYLLAMKGESIEASNACVQEWEELKTIRAQKKQIEERENEIIENLKLEIKNAEMLVHTDQETGEIKILATWKNMQTETFDEKSFQKDHPDMWLDYQFPPMTAGLDKDKLKKEQKETYKEYCKKIDGSRRLTIK